MSVTARSARVCTELCADGQTVCAPRDGGALNLAGPARDLDSLAYCILHADDVPLVQAAAQAGLAAADWFVLSDTDAARRFLSAGTEQRILILVPADRLTVSELSGIRAQFGEDAGRIGFVAGRSAAGLIWTLGKALAPARPDLPALDDFDAVDHALDHAAGDVDALRARLTRPVLTKVFLSHGEGSHAKFPGLTVCGLLDDAEFAESPELGCNRGTRHCKRQPPLAGNRVVFGDEIVAQTVFFLCCNGFSFAQELYPSHVSVALSLAEGQVGAVVAPIRPVTVPKGLYDWLLGRIGQGGRLGAIVGRTELPRRGIGTGPAIRAAR